MPIINIKRSESYYRDANSHDENCPCASLSKSFAKANAALDEKATNGGAIHTHTAEHCEPVMAALPPSESVAVAEQSSCDDACDIDVAISRACDSIDSDISPNKTDGPESSLSQVAMPLISPAVEAHDHLKALFDDQQIRFLNEIKGASVSELNVSDDILTAPSGVVKVWGNTDPSLQVPTSWRRSSKATVRPVRKRCVTRTEIPAMQPPAPTVPAAADSSPITEIPKDHGVVVTRTKVGSRHKELAPPVRRQFEKHEDAICDLLGTRNRAVLVPILVACFLMTGVLLIAAVSCTKTVTASQQHLKPQTPGYPWLGADGSAVEAPPATIEPSAEDSERAIPAQQLPITMQPAAEVPQVSAQHPGNFPTILEQQAPPQNYAYRTPPQVRVYTY